MKLNLTLSSGIRKLGLVCATAIRYGFVSNLQGGIDFKEIMAGILISVPFECENRCGQKSTDLP